MGLSVSLLLIAVGLILALAVHAQTGVLEVSTIGWILTIVGFVGLLISLIVNAPHDDARTWRRWW